MLHLCRNLWPPRVRWGFGLGLGLVVALALAQVVGLHQAASHPPAPRRMHPVVFPTEHPYDPDWLEVQWLLNTKCFGCHRPGTKQSDLSSYEALLQARTQDGEPVVVPFEPDESPLWHYVAWNPQADPDSTESDTPLMPPEMEHWLTAGQLRVLRRWIARGALKYRLPPGCKPRPVELDFPSAKQCKVCHPRQYEQWARSMHAYAQHSPVMEAFTRTLLERTSGTLGTFCTRCHTPIGTSLGEGGNLPNVYRSRLSMEGVTCVVCHRMKQQHYKSSGRQFIQPGDVLTQCIYGPFEDPVRVPGDHPSQGRPFIKTSEFCGTCHDVISPQGVRLEEAFSEWRNSPAAKQGITCQHCHMGPVPGVPVPDQQRPLGRAAEVPGVPPEKLPLRRLSDHSFVGPDYSLLPDTEFPHKLDWMYEVDYRQPERLTPYQQKTLEQLRRRNRRDLAIARTLRYQLLKNAARLEWALPQRVKPGSRVKLRVAVRSLFSGHNFPTGFTAERQLWVQVVVRDSRGRVVFRSGDLDPNGDLRDEHSYFVQTGKLPADHQLLNFQSKFIVLGVRGTERPVILAVNRDLSPLNILRPAVGISQSFGRPQVFRIAKASLPPLGRREHVYRFRAPQECGPLVVEARLCFRHLPPSLLDRIGIPHLKHLLEIVVINQRRGVLQVGTFPAASAEPTPSRPAEVVPLPQNTGRFQFLAR